SIDDIQRTLGFITYVDVASIRSNRRAVVDLNACDLADDFVGCGIDDTHHIAGAIGLNDSDLAAACGCFMGVAPHPGCKSWPFGIVLRQPMFSSIVAVISAGLLRKRMREKLALERIAGNDSCPNNLEVFARLFVVPG